MEAELDQVARHKRTSSTLGHFQSKVSQLYMIERGESYLIAWTIQPERLLFAVYGYWKQFTCCGRILSVVREI